MNINSSSKPIKNIRAKIKSAMGREEVKNNNTEIHRCEINKCEIAFEIQSKKSEKTSDLENNTNNNHVNYTQEYDTSQRNINLDKIKGTIIIFIDYYIYIFSLINF